MPGKGLGLALVHRYRGLVIGKNCKDLGCALGLAAVRTGNGMWFEKPTVARLRAR